MRVIFRRYFFSLGIKCVFWIIDGIVQTTAFLAFECLTRDEIAYVDHVSQFADVFGGLDSLKEVFGLFVEKIKTFPCTMQA